MCVTAPITSVEILFLLWFIHDFALLSLLQYRKFAFIGKLRQSIGNLMGLTGLVSLFILHYTIQSWACQGVSQSKMVVSPELQISIVIIKSFDTKGLGV